MGAGAPGPSSLRPGVEPAPGWQPKVVALDIDGTLLAWVDGQELPYETITPAVYDAIHRARDAGAHIVLASGRSPHGMTTIADLLDLPLEGSPEDPTPDYDDRLWVVAANGSVLFRYPPFEVVHEETFDAAPAVRAILEHHPDALVAAEERAIGGYLVNRLFPEGELTGEQVVTPIEEIVGQPVNRVVVRDPESTAEDFMETAAKLGLHGTDYVVGWSAWIDFAPEGISKASGLQHVCDKLGVDPADVLAIGDGRNDLEMLAWAGRGVAMGQAIEEVQVAADAVTATVHDDGVAVELDRWFPRG
ncbi:HAD family phosphatase [Nocardioides sp. Y6]|uniref:HAD family phosphatase n=1 Tax=Nocardioides malaquae TaxID=2773426 RepID=A0ABR9RSL1_9ACTN|nr:HAD family hydrolase [Nocardioides malaquae]MBE7324135.1 HAD family phosphatase [Nocardioides malaquae]